MWASRYRACLIEPHPDSLRDCISFLEHTPAKSGVVAPGAAWPWLFLDSKHSAGKSKRDEQHFEAVSSALEKGLVYGGTNFRKKIAAQAGIRTEPGRRGRPPIHRESGMAKNDGGA